MLGFGGMVADISLNGMASPGNATVGQVPNIAPGETSNTNVPVPGPWGVTQLLPGAVVQLSGSGQYVIPTGMNPIQGIGALGGQLLGGAGGSMQVDIAVGTAAATQGVLYLIGSSTSQYMGISLGASNTPSMTIADANGTSVVSQAGTGTFAAGQVIQVRMFWNSTTGATSISVNGKFVGDKVSAWTPWVPQSILYGNVPTGFGGLTQPFAGRLIKVQASNTPSPA
jgi:hypothetical protein